ncbi:ankyrin repeat domain-containing protein [Variovorax sp. dw_954]|uniref:ankyrin repeat domain-containing protein n=1 Tax=Variovorax sp. dw_954 TaxID=2720078 RepID=UPI001BD57822|nr:ankyrin repeat domain-containing protein [Variovorax sp. dw_954]
MHSCKATAVVLAAGMLIGAAGGALAAEPVASATASTAASAMPACAGIPSQANDGGEPTADTPLSRAAAANDFAQVQAMIRCGADPQLKSGDGWYPIHTAVQAGSPVIVELLARQGANPNARGDYLGWTPLHVAVQGKANAAVVKVLLARGANPAIADTRGETPYDLAKAAGRADIAALLKRR